MFFTRYTFSVLIISCSFLGFGCIASSYADPSGTTFPAPLKIAFCLTGQLARLELLTKIKYVFYANTQIGNQIDVFALLDNNFTDVKQTFWRFDYSDNPYVKLTAAGMKDFLRNNFDKYTAKNTAEKAGKALFRVRYAPPTQANFTVRDNNVPVTDKTGPDDPHTVGAIEPAAVRFQNNLRWLAGLRDCVKWVQATEYHQKWFYDVVVRLREDSYALGPWLITPSKYMGGFVSADIGTNFGVNDHNFAVDRRWADALYRGVTEDYYFNETLDMFSWNNPERRIYKVAMTKNIPMRLTNVCEQPLLPLRGLQNKTHWRLHPTYVALVQEACSKDKKKLGLEQDKEDSKKYDGSRVQGPGCCSRSWAQVLDWGASTITPL